MSRQLNLADGQLAATSAAILGAAKLERTVGITLYNTSEGVEQTVVLTVTRSGGSARTIFRSLLKPLETRYVSGIGLDPSDVLAGYASYASAVDYLVTLSAGPFTVTAKDKYGAPKSSESLTVSLPDKLDIDQGTLTVIGLLEEIRDIALKIA